MRVYIMIGCPGSGKSTWANKEGLMLVSRDIIREKLGLCNSGEKTVGSREEEDEVTRLETDMIAKLLKGNKDFAIDDTNLNEKFRKELLDFIKAKNPKAVRVGIRVTTSIETCIKRREGQIPAPILRKMHEKVSKVNPGEFDEFKEVSGE